jgi:hypothetical protein
MHTHAQGRTLKFIHTRTHDTACVPACLPELIQWRLGENHGERTHGFVSVTLGTEVVAAVLLVAAVLVAAVLAAPKWW